MKVMTIFIKIALTAAAIIASVYVGVFAMLILLSEGVHPFFAYIGMVVLPSLLLPFIWVKKRKIMQLLMKKIRTRMLTSS